MNAATASEDRWGIVLCVFRDLVQFSSSLDCKWKLRGEAYFNVNHYAFGSVRIPSVRVDGGQTWPYPLANDLLRTGDEFT